MDIKTTSLSENLVEDRYITQPNGSIIVGETGKICKLQKFIYKLKQVSKN